MSKKRNKKTANKSLETLKRKQYARGGRGGKDLIEPKGVKPKPRDLFDDSIKEPKAPLPRPKPTVPANERVSTAVMPGSVTIPNPKVRTETRADAPIASPYSDVQMESGKRGTTASTPERVSEQEKRQKAKEINDRYVAETQTTNFKDLFKRYNDSKGTDKDAQRQIEDIQNKYRDENLTYQTQASTPPTFRGLSTERPFSVPNSYLDEEPRQTVYNEDNVTPNDFSNLTPAQLARLGEDLGRDVKDTGVNTGGRRDDGGGANWWEEAGYDTVQDALADGWTLVDGVWTPQDGNNNNNGGGNNNNGGDTETPYDTGPLNVENKRPDEAVLDQMTATKIKGLSRKREASYKKELANPDLSEDRRREVTIALEAAGRSTNIQKLDQAGTVTSAGVSAPTMAPAAQGTVTTGTLPPDVVANTYKALMAGDLLPTEAAQMLDDPTIAEADEAELTERAEAATRDAAQEKAALQKDPEAFDRDVDSVIKEVSFREPVDVGRTKDAEAAEREAIIGTKATERDAARIIETVGFEAAQRRTVTGTAAKSTAAKMLSVVGELPPEITAAIVDDPATVTAQIDSQPVEVRAAIAALPTEALVSSQIESLLGGMEDGEVPMWARPAVQSVNDMLVRRGMSASSVGRDALFNSIIQSAMPLAQSNAQALQATAAQNLSNQQQANMSQATLDMQRRMANLSNEQASESQTAQMAQQMSAMQSQFRQDAVMTTAQQQQQTRTQNLANRQDQAKTDAQNDAAMRAQNLGNEQQIELADMQYMNATESENMSAIQQERMAELQVGADFLAKNAGFKQQMELANLGNDQQMRLANLSALNQADSESMSAEQQTELANLNTRMQTNLTQAKIAESMGVAQLSVDQQRAVTNASMVANIDLTKYSAVQQVALTNSKFMQTMVLTDFNAEQQAAMQNATALATMDMANADQRTKLAITNAQSFLSRDMANLNNRQQAVILDQQMRQQRLLSDQSALNTAEQFNATSQNQADQFNNSLAANMEQFNASQTNAMEQFNVQETNRQAAVEAGNQLQADSITAQINADLGKFNEQSDLQRDQWNAANAQAIEQSNVQWRRQANTADTAAANAANQQNVQNAYNISALDQTQIWQTLRDEAAYVRQAYENNEQREAQLIATAIGNESGAAKDSTTSTSALLQLIRNYGGI